MKDDSYQDGLPAQTQKESNDQAAQAPWKSLQQSIDASNKEASSATELRQEVGKIKADEDDYRLYMKSAMGTEKPRIFKQTDITGQASGATKEQQDQAREDLYEQSGHKKSQTLSQKYVAEEGVTLGQVEQRRDESREESPGRVSNASQRGNVSLNYGRKRRSKDR